MVTTIQLNDITIKTLRMYKEQHKLKTYDDVILFLLGRGEYAKKFRGIIKGISREELLKDLRDKKDRF